MKFEDGTTQPTWVVRISGGRLWPEAWGRKLAELGYNLTITETIGTWEGKTECGVTFTHQADDVADLLATIARYDDDVRWVHVERHDPSTFYVDLGWLRIAQEGDGHE